jgi:hypothetical protein
MAGHDFVPGPDAEFDEFFNHYYQYVNKKCTGQSPEWTHIPEAHRTELTNAYIDWVQAYSKIKLAHTPSETLAKNLARQRDEKILRDFNNEFILYSSAVSPEEKKDLGNHLHDPHPTPVPAPTTVPELEVRAGFPRQVVIAYWDKGSSRRGKPKDIHGIEIRWALLDHPPATIGELDNSSFDTRSPLTLTFGEEDRGRRIYLAGRWEIEREGIKGDFGDIVSAIIP